MPRRDDNRDAAILILPLHAHMTLDAIYGTHAGRCRAPGRHTKHINFTRVNLMLTRERRPTFHSWTRAFRALRRHAALAHRH